MMYFAIIEKEPDSLWSVYFPDIDGCIAAADTMEKASEQAISALRHAYEGAQQDGVAMPTPRSLEAVMEIFAEGGRQGVSIIAVPLLKNPIRPTRINVSIAADLLASIDDAASQRDMTRSDFLALAALEYINRPE